MLKIFGFGLLGMIVVTALFAVHSWRDETLKKHELSVLRQLTPETLIANCGQPESDEQSDFRGLHVLFTRSMKYAAPEGWAILEFQKDHNASWKLTHFASPQVGVRPEDENAYIAVPQMPCIDRPQDVVTVILKRL